jgi:cell wall-associated NlpC family hydrolase
MPTSDDVVKKAREFLRVPFHHLGRSRAGIDCTGVILCVAEELGLRDLEGTPILKSDYPDYSANPAGQKMFNECSRRLIVKPDVHSIEPGDVLNMAVPGDPLHLAIAASRGGVISVIHAFNWGKMRVIEHRLDPHWRRRIKRVFRFPGVE